MRHILLNNLEGIGFFIFGIYFITHLPAIILLVIGLVQLKKKPKQAKVFLIIAGVYFLVGGGVCASLLA